MEITQTNNGNEDEEDNQRRHKRAKHVEKDRENPSIHPMSVSLTIYDPSSVLPIAISLGGPGGNRSTLMILRFELLSHNQKQKVVVRVTGGSCATKLPNSAASEIHAGFHELVSGRRKGTRYVKYIICIDI